MDFPERCLCVCCKDAIFAHNGLDISAMDKKKLDIAYFVSFCIEQYKNEKGMTGTEAMQELDKYGVLDYLCEFYEPLHTQSRQWILADIDNFINLRKHK